MISSVSFTSIYKVKSEPYYTETYNIFKNYAAKRSRKDAIMELEEKRTPSNSTSTIKLTVQNYNDKSVEDFCAQNGIKYTKCSKGKSYNSKISELKKDMVTKYC